MKDKHFWECEEGVHLAMAVGEHMVCGIACDAYETGDHPSQISRTDKKTVTCKRCVAEIRNMRGVRIK